MATLRDANDDDDVAGSRYLASSLSSLSAQRQQASQIAKAYRQAAQLFLTRRLPEALSTIEPIITSPPCAPDGSSLAGHAPVATASRGSRVKVWSFYLTFLNAVVELGAEEGKHAFGSARWKKLVATCRDGSVWDDVVRNGYAGIEADVDVDVVINLATLLLTHSPSQRLNQQKLETYLAATAHPTLDVAQHMSSSAYQQRRQSHGYPPRASHNGTDTPRDLEKRIKLLELYTLHVLPRNEEWGYARDFISMSELLDDERKDAFLLALHSLKEERDDAETREQKLRQQQQEQMEERRKEIELTRLRQMRAEDEQRKRDEANKKQSLRPDQRLRQKPPRPPSQPSRPSQPPVKRPLTPPPTFYHRATSMFASVHALVSDTAHNLTANPMAFFRTLLFLIVFGLAFARRGLRERILRLIRNAMDKVKQTIGMGVKVSYI